MQKRMINILLVEDDAVDVHNVNRAFQRYDISHPIFIASNGIEALSMLRGNSDLPQVPAYRRLILLDLNMPRMNGFEFLQELRQDADLCRIPVVVLTTSSEDGDRLQAYRFNIAGYILKSDSFGRFAESIAILNRYWSLCELP